MLPTDIIVSFSPSIRRPKVTRKPLADVLAMMRTPTMRAKIERLQAIADKKQRTMFKSDNLPWFAMGVFTGDQCDNDHLEASHGCVLDIDDIDDATALRTLLGSDRYVLAAFISPSGRGVKAVVAWDAPALTPEQHTERWQQCVEYMSLRYDIDIDNCPDARRACYLSYDADMVVNASAEPFPLYVTTQYPQEVYSCERSREEIMSACEYLAGKLQYHDRLKAGLAIASELGESGVDCYLALTNDPVDHPHETPDKMRAKYANLLSKNRGKIDGSTLFYYALQAGWTKPAKPTGGSKPTKSHTHTQAHSTTTTLLYSDNTVPAEFQTEYSAQMNRGTLTDVAVAGLWRMRYGHDWRYNNDESSWYGWDGRRWLKDSRNLVVQTGVHLGSTMARASFPGNDDRQKYVRKVGRDMQSLRRINAILSLAATHPDQSCESKDFEQHREFITCRNGIVNLRTGELLPFDRDMMFRHYVDAAFDIDACASMSFFPQFCQDTLVDDHGYPDMDMLDYMQRAFGYTLTGLVDQQCLFFLFGEGQNGKSQWTLLLAHLLGEYCHVLKPNVIAQSYSYNPDPSIAALEGKRMALVGELSERIRLEESIVKTLTGGDPLEANQKYMIPHKFYPAHKIWMLGNNKPEISATDNGIWRRIHLIQMRAVIPQEQRLEQSEVQARFHDEIDGIFTWAVEGARKALAQRVDLPERMQAEVAAYREEEDVVGRFAEECLDRHPGGAIPAADVFKAYEFWCKNNHERSEKSRKFYDKLRLHHIDVSAKDADGMAFRGNITHVVGFSLRRMEVGTDENWYR